MKDIEAFRAGIVQTIGELREAAAFQAGDQYIKLILKGKAQLLNELGEHLGLCAPFDVHFDESLGKDTVSIRDPRDPTSGIVLEIDDEDLIHNLIRNTERWVMVSRSRSTAKRTTASDPEYHSPAWFQGEYGITSNTIRGVYHRAKERIRRTKAPGRAGYLYSLVDLKRERDDLFPGH